MQTVHNIYEFINQIAPFETQEPWDNGGMLVGDMKNQVNTVALALDITQQTIKEAAAAGAELIISHHPVIFSPQKSFIKGNPAYELAKHGIDAICAHTSLDIADGGVNDVLLQQLELNPVTVENLSPLLRTGSAAGLSPENLAKVVSEKLNASVRYVDGKKSIYTVAVCGGAGGDFIEEIAKAGIDAYVTGEAKHHELLTAQAQGITMVIAGHFETETLVTPVLAEKLSKAFPDLNVIVLQQDNPVKTIE